MEKKKVINGLKKEGIPGESLKKEIEKRFPQGDRKFNIWTGFRR